MRRGPVCCAALPIEARATGEAMFGGEAVSGRLAKGRTLKTTGDGMLIEFANAVETARIAAG